MYALKNEPVRIAGALDERQEKILSPEAVRFLTSLAREFEPERRRLLAARKARQLEFDSGQLPDFSPATESIRKSEWRVAPIPADLQNRRVEITGPVDRKMIINALNSGACVFMADFEDSTSPKWRNIMDGQVNLYDAVRGTITYQGPEGKQYRLSEEIATLMVRPRGWHLVEKHFLVDGEPISASLFDFGLFFFHNAAALLRAGSGPYFYLPKIESHREARLWNEVFLFAQRKLGLSAGCIRATVLIETILAAFEMDEILWELRDHSAGLNCGRWDYIFSFIKKFRCRPEFTLPDRAQVTMATHFLESYSRLLIETCHRRGAHAIGGMAAYIPVRGDAAANETALERVRQDKLREVWNGHDGTWVAHPGLVPLACKVFDTYMPNPNQIERRLDFEIGAADLLSVPAGEITPGGFAHNIQVGLQYLTAWISGNGCVPIRNLMEDAATAEICRAQVWQWRSHCVRMSDGRFVTPHLIRQVIADCRRELAGSYEAPDLANAARLFENLTTAAEFDDFLTLRAYEHLD